MESGNLGRQTFASYLAKHYLVEKGYQLGTVPEAAALAAASDIVLTLATGLTFQIVCIIDREARPDASFALDRATVEAIGTECLRYAGTMQRSQMPVAIQILEIGGPPLDDAQRRRLKALRLRSGIRSKVDISSWRIDVKSRSVWTTALYNGWLAGAPYIRRLLREPRVGDEALRALAWSPVGTTGFPWLTSVILALLAAVFALEQIFSLDPTSGDLAPSLRTLVALGALQKPLVLGGGEWFRLLTATVLHGDVFHLLFNGIALLMAGVVLERLVGRAWFGAFYVTGALGGSLMSLAVNPAASVSIGASGAIMGLFTAAYACSFRMPSGGHRQKLQIGLLRILIPSLIPLANFGRSAQIDYGAHAGGALAGAIAGMAVLRFWPRTEALPRLRPLALALSLAGALAFAATVPPIMGSYRVFVLASRLIPEAALPKSDAEGRARSADLVARYPHDPRSRLMRAEALLEGRDRAGAERELRAGLAEEEILQSAFSPDLEAQLRTILGLVLAETGRDAEGRTVAAPVCAPAAPAKLRELLTRQRLCP